MAMEVVQMSQELFRYVLCIRLHKDIVVSINWKEDFLEGKL